jgi:putative membrane protein
MRHMAIRNLALGVSFVLAGTAVAADPPATADVLAKLHHANQTEIAMGEIAKKNGQSKETKAFGKTLVKDHGAADKKVVALAKKEKLTLPEDSADKGMGDMPAGADFDATFAQSMLDDHTKDVAEVTTARDTTTDADLKKLLSGLLPTLQKHKDTAQRLVDGAKKVDGPKK